MISLPFKSAPMRSLRAYRFFAKALSVLAVIVASNAACAESRIGAAAVRDEQGVPCFAIADLELRRAGEPMLGSLEVHDATVKPVVRIWSFALRPPGRTQSMPARICILYGHAPSESEVAQEPVPLQAGRIYEVFLNASPTDATDPTFGYDARFCLVAQVDGGVKVHQLVYRDGWHVEECHPN